MDRILKVIVFEQICRNKKKETSDEDCSAEDKNVSKLTGAP